VGRIDAQRKKGAGTVKRAGMVRVGLYLSEVQVKRIKALSMKKGLTVSEMIRRMIDEGLEKKAKM
jgi:hypothetical protein